MKRSTARQGGEPGRSRSSKKKAGPVADTPTETPTVAVDDPTMTAGPAVEQSPADEPMVAADAPAEALTVAVDEPAVITGPSADEPVIAADTPAEAPIVAVDEPAAIAGPSADEPIVAAERSEPTTPRAEPPVETIAAEMATSKAEASVEPVPFIPVRTLKSMEQVIMKSTEELIAFGQGNVEAIVKSGQIWVTGLQGLSKQVAAGAQASFDETVSAFKAMSSAKTIKDAMELQTGFARSAFEKSMTESGKLTEASLKLAEQAVAPITARVTAAMDTMVKAP